VLGPPQAERGRTTVPRGHVWRGRPRSSYRRGWSPRLRKVRLSVRQHGRSVGNSTVHLAVPKPGSELARSLKSSRRVHLARRGSASGMAASRPRSGLGATRPGRGDGKRVLTRSIMTRARGERPPVMNGRCSARVWRSSEAAVPVENVIGGPTGGLLDRADLRI